MNKLNEMMTDMYIRANNRITRFMESERGDTNFVSMLIIIGIVVVLAGLFLALGEETMTLISTKVKTFISTLGK